MSRRLLLSGTAAAVAGAAYAPAAAQAETLDQPFTAPTVPHLVQAEQMVQYQRLLAAGHLTESLSGQWPLGGDGRDRSGGNHPLTVGAGATWTDDRAGGELTLTGTSSAATGAVLDTTAPFTVSAWVRLTGPLSEMYTAVSQDSATTSRFLLQFDPALGWAFKVRSADGSVKVSAVATTAAVLDGWVHLAGVSNGLSLSLSVDGVLEGSATSTVTPWAATRSLQIGQATWQGAAVNRWTGSISDVRVYQRALTADELAVVAGRTARRNNTYVVGAAAEVVWGDPARPTTWLSRARCASFVSAVLKRSYPWATGEYFRTWFGDPSPEAAEYRAGFAGDPGPRLRRIDRVADLLPGDLIAIEYDNDPDNTGHIVMVREVKGVHTGSLTFPGETQYAVEILDCTSDPHGMYGLATYAPFPDTRMVADTGNFTGAGIGHMMFYASDTTGLFTRYRWSVNTKATGAHPVATRPIAAARVL